MAFTTSCAFPLKCSFLLVSIYPVASAQYLPTV